MGKTSVIWVRNPNSKLHRSNRPASGRQRSRWSLIVEVLAYQGSLRISRLPTTLSGSLIQFCLFLQDPCPVRPIAEPRRRRPDCSRVALVNWTTEVLRQRTLRFVMSRTCNLFEALDRPLPLRSEMGCAQYCGGNQNRRKSEEYSGLQCSTSSSEIFRFNETKWPEIKAREATRNIFKTERPC